MLYILIGFDLNLPLDEFGAVDFDYVQNLAGKHAYCTMNKLVFSLYLESCREFFVLLISLFFSPIFRSCRTSEPTEA